MKWFKKQKLSMQLLVVLMISLTVLITVFYNILIEVRGQMRLQEEEYIESLVNQLSQNVQQNYTSFNKIMHLVSFNRSVQEFLLTDDKVEHYSNFSRVKDLFSDVSILNAHILDIIIMDSNDIRYSLSDNMVYPLPDLDLENTTPVVSDIQSFEYFRQPISYIVIGQNIYSIDSYLQTSSQIGVLYLVLSPEALTGGEYPVATSNSIIVQLADDQNQVLWESENNRGNEKEEFTKDFSADTIISNYSIDVYRRLPVIWEDLSAWKNSVSILYLFLLVFLVILWGVLMRNLIKPMHELAQFAEQMSDTNLHSLERRMQLNGYKEISIVSNQINNMLEKIQHLTETLLIKNKELYQSQVYAKQAEISYLRSQINPHFLYNTLETMCGIAYSENQPHLAEIAKALSLIFKYSIKGKDVVSLKDELKIVKSYILIQSVRFASRFTTEYEIDDKCLTKMVPKMILQPLIENAITHGVEEQEELCHLVIKVFMEEKKLYLQVIDDGAGIAPDILDDLQEQLKDSSKWKNEEETVHIGVANVHNRIRLLYGPPYGLYIESEMNMGTQVSIILPLQDNDFNYKNPE